MKLQIALDVWSLKEAFAILEEVAQNIDIIEAGTPLVVTEGINSIARIKERYPEKSLVIDTKITDESHIANKAFDAKADYATVLGIMSDESVKAAIEIGKQKGKEVIVDLMNVKDKVKRAKEVKKFGGNYVLVHCGLDEQKLGKTPLKELKSVKQSVDIKVAVAGGINLDTIDDYIKAKADIIVVGNTLIKNSDRKEISKAMKDKILKAEENFV